MSDAAYALIRALWRPAFDVSGRPTVLGRENVPPRGPFLLAATHTSPYDVPLLILHSPRPLDFVGDAATYRLPLINWLYRAMNVIPLERTRADPTCVRGILRRLECGRAVALFPEGRIRAALDSMITTGRFHPGVVRLAVASGASVVPCVILNSAAYTRIPAWLPLRRTRYAVAYGPPLAPGTDTAALEARVLAAFRALHASIPNSAGQRTANP